MPFEQAEQAQQVGARHEKRRRVVGRDDDGVVGAARDRLSGEAIDVELKRRRVEGELHNMTCRSGVGVFVERWHRNDQFRREATREDLDQLGGSVSDHDALGRLADELADQTRDDVLRDRVVEDKFVDLTAIGLEQRLRREVQVVEVGVVDEAMAPVTAVL